MRYRMLALDLDGSLLDPEGRLPATTRGAVSAVRERGVQVVLCTGRRYRTTRFVLEELGLDGPVVVQNGAVVKDARTGRTLRGSFVPRDAYRRGLRILSSLGPPVVYVDGARDSEIDMLAGASHEHHAFLAEYLAANRDHVSWVASLEMPPEENVVMLSTMSDEQRLADAREEIDASLGARLRTNLLANKGYRGHILEIVSSEAGKWPRLLELAQTAGIAPSEILAIGDDTNDLEMIQAVGMGVAMGNAPAALRDAADHVTASNAADGAAEVIRRFVL